MVKSPSMTKRARIFWWTVAGILSIFLLYKLVMLRYSDSSSPLLAPAVAIVGIANSLVQLRMDYRTRETKRRVKQGLCIRCGYDCRTSTDRCPECGEVLG